MVVSHISERLKGHTALAIDTAMPTFAFTSTDGNVAGKSVGSIIVLS
jgi:hypothetical protein